MHKPTDSVRVVLFDKKDQSKFLILTEADDPGNWKLPGGSFDHHNEPPEAAAYRELEEELSISKQQVDFTNYQQLENDDGVSKRYIFHAVADSESVSPTPEIGRIKWAKADQVPDAKNKNHILTAVNI